jgi:hypothetical protein
MVSEITVEYLRAFPAERKGFVVDLKNPLKTKCWKIFQHFFFSRFQKRVAQNLP